VIRIFIVIQLVCAAFLLATCERSNMYDLAKYGLPPQSAIYLFAIGQQPGNFGGRKNADDMCYRQGIAYHTVVKASTVKAFISFSVIDEMRFLVPAQYWYYPVIGISPAMVFTTISNSWLDLWNGTPLIAGVNTSVGIATTWWSGSNNDGSVTVNDTCSEWQKSDTTTGRIGDAVVSSLSASPACSSLQYVLCITY